MRHRDWLLRLLDGIWNDYDTKRRAAHDHDEYVHAHQRQLWLDEIMEDVKALESAGA